MLKRLISLSEGNASLDQIIVLLTLLLVNIFKKWSLYALIISF